jgi:NAD(P)H-hydrate epimerase
MTTTFRTDTGVMVPAVTAGQMREVDRLAVEEFGLGILQMMENAGRILAAQAMEMLGRGGDSGGEVVVLAGSGGNGGGGLCCARHLANHGVSVAILLDRDAAALAGAAAAQMRVLSAAGLTPAPGDQTEEILGRSALVVDALIGYGLRGPAQGRAAKLIDLCNSSGRSVLALDVPSGLDATTGEVAGPVVRAHRTLTLALPKTGLSAVAKVHLADIGIPPAVYRRLGLRYTPPFGAADVVRLSVGAE